MTKEGILAAIARVASQAGGRLPLHKFTKLAGITGAQIRRWFPQGWHAALDAAGIGARAFQLPLTDDQLLAQYHEVVHQLGRIPTWKQLRATRGRSASIYTRRFGTKTRIVAEWRAWAKRHDRPVPDPQARPVLPVDPEHAYGAMLALGTLGHAPLNEAGVIHAFGVLGQALGFVVVRIRTRFPDCDALRRVPGGTDQWQRVRIEFEYRSSNFERHGHDASGCDLVVCWEHDWPQCPVEVLELRKEVGRLRGDEKLRAC